MRRLSEEELRQKEKEERSRMRLQEQAYREAQRSVYARIYQEQDAMPEDYREAFRDDPRDRYRDESREDDWPPPRERRYREPPREYYDEDGDWEETRDQRFHSDEWRRPEEPRRRPHPTDGDRGKRPPVPPKPVGNGGKKRRRRKRLLTVLAVLLALLALGLIAHAFLVRAPEIPGAAGSQGEGTAPGSLGGGRKEDVYTFLLVGRDDGGGGNTDTIMAACYDVKNGALDVLSIYRDTLVDVPWEIPKINSVYNRQGIEGVQEQIKNLIGYAPDYYFVVEMDMVAELVDAIGGVKYDVPYNMDYDDPTQDLHIHFKKGPQRLNGEDAVKLLRWRKNNSGEALSVGDVGRVEIQHSFLKSMASQMISLGTLPRIKQILNTVDENLISNLDYGEMLWFAERALLMDKEAIQFHNLPGDYTGTMWSPTYQNYQSYVFVNNGELLDLVNQRMNPFIHEITPDMQHVVHGTTVNNLSDAGMDGQSGGSAGAD